MPYYDYSDWLGDFVWYLFVPNLIGRFCLRLDVSLSFWEKFRVPAISVYHISAENGRNCVWGHPHSSATPSSVQSATLHHSCPPSRLQSMHLTRP